MDLRPVVVVSAALALAGAAGAAESKTVQGTNGPDTLIGTPAADVLVGLAGHDELYGGAGDDRLLGGPGKDHLFGGDGNDVLIGGPARDLWPQSPPFRRERLVGGRGNDVLVAHIGGAVFLAGRGNDRVDSRDSATHCPSFALADANPCIDWVLAGTGDDRIDSRDGNGDFVQCDAGRDVVLADRRDSVRRDCEIVRRR